MSGIYRVRLRTAVQRATENEASAGGGTSETRSSEKEIELEAPALGIGSVSLRDLLRMAHEELKTEEGGSA